MTDLLFLLIGRLFLSIAPEGRFPGWNRFALRIMGAKLGERAVVYSSIRVARELKLSIGTESFVGSRSVFVGGTGSSVTIGNYCDISDNVHFVTGTHEIATSGNRRAGKGYSKDIVVGDGVWIGYNALILPGVIIGDKAIIGAGTIVHKNVPPNVVVGGNPMKIIRNL